MINNKVLVLSKLFAPNNTIGARRWSKFAKYFIRKNIEVHVLTSAGGNTKNESYWFKDYIKSNIKISFYNSVLDKYKSLPLFIRKIILRLHNFKKRYSKLIFTESEIFSIFIKTKQILIEENISHLIITGPPCELFFVGVLIKSEIPDIILTIDYRDPWTNVRDEYLLNKNKTKNKIDILIYEQLVLNIANNIVVVTETMKHELQMLYNIKSMVHVISNGYDRDDFSKLDAIIPFEKKTKYNIIYTGTLGKSREGRLKFLILLSRIIEDLNDDWFLENISIHIYSELNRKDIKEKSTFFNNNIIFNPIINNTILLSILQKSDMCLSINHEQDKYAFGTKIFDYIFLTKPIIHISNGGELYDILDRNKHFVSDYNSENIKNLLFNIKSFFEKDKKFDINNKFENYDIENLSEKYLQLLFCK